MIGALDSHVPAGPLDERVDPAQVRHEAGAPEQPPQVRRHRRRHRPGRRRAPPPRSASWATTSRSSRSTTRPGGRTRSPPRAASTRPRTTRTTATRSTASSTTRSRAATSAPARRTCYRLAEVSVDIIDQCVAQGVPFAREYGGLLDNRSFGGAQVSPHLLRPGPDRPAAAARRLPGADAPGRTPAPSSCTPRSEMLDLVVKDGVACGIIVRDLVTGEVSRHSAHAVLLCTGGYGNVFFLSTNAKNSQRHGRRGGPTGKGALFANPCYTQIHPTCIPASDEFQSKLTLMSESLRNDGRIWVPKDPDDDPLARPDPRGRARLLPRAQVPGVRQPRAPRRRLPQRQDDGRRGQGRRPAARTACTSTSPTPSSRLGASTIRERYGNLFDMYERITDENPYKVPMRIYPAIHYTMGGLWVDYNLMSNVPGLFVLGEANFSDHGANRLGASALMQGLADGYFVHPLHARQLPRRPARHRRRCPPTTRCSPRREHDGRRPGEAVPVGRRHQVGRPLPPRARQDHVGLLRHGPQQDRPREGPVRDPRPARGVLEGRPGARRRPDAQPVAREGRPRRRLLRAGRADGAATPSHREESCGGHFREEHQTEDGEAQRDDEHFATSAAWEWAGEGSPPDAATRSRSRSSTST